MNIAISLKCKLIHICYLISFVLTGCGKIISYEDQITKILDYEKCNGEFSNEQFDEVFKLIETNPETLVYDFPEIDNIRIITSNDGNVRGYVVERCGFGGNPSHGFDTRTLIQYRIGVKTYTIRLPENYSILHDIVKLTDNDYVFIDTWSYVAFGSHNHNRARVFQIDEAGLAQIPNVFSNEDGLSDEYDIAWEEGYCETDDDTYLALIEKYDVDDIDNLLLFYNWLDNTLYVANTTISSISDNDILDGTFNRFQWNGSRFDDVTIMKPYEVRNDDYYICIEQSSDGKCTYRCWNGGIKDGNPNLTIKDGKRELWDEIESHDYNKWISFDEYKPLGEKYVFENNGYKYQYMTGWLRGQTYEDLEVYDPNDELIYSGIFRPVE